jgi:hypothetical protein
MELRMPRLSLNIRYFLDNQLTLAKSARRVSVSGTIRADDATAYSNDEWYYRRHGQKVYDARRHRQQ